LNDDSSSRKVKEKVSDELVKRCIPISPEDRKAWDEMRDICRDLVKMAIKTNMVDWSSSLEDEVLQEVNSHIAADIRTKFHSGKLVQNRILTHANHSLYIRKKYWKRVFISPHEENDIYSLRNSSPSLGSEKAVIIINELIYESLKSLSLSKYDTLMDYYCVEGELPELNKKEKRKLRDIRLGLKNQMIMVITNNLKDGIFDDKKETFQRELLYCLEKCGKGSTNFDELLQRYLSEDILEYIDEAMGGSEKGNDGQ